MSDSFSAKATLGVSGREYEIYRLDALQSKFDIARLPYSLKVLLENALRLEDGESVTAEDVETIASWDAAAEPADEIPFQPARVLMQDFTGVPAIVDLAAMRDAIDELGSDPAKINPLVPVDLVIDHSVQVDAFGSARAFDINADRDYERNRERYAFLRWGQQAFDNFRVVPPATGICHQVNLEYLSQVVFSREADGVTQAYPDTLVGTDSHTTMVNGLGVLGWGVGGIEAEAAMLGQPISMLLPQVVGFRLDGELPEGATATDLVLTVTEMLRERGVVSKFVEFFGPGMHTLGLADRATIGNMSPEFGSTCAIFPVDARDPSLSRVHRPADRDDRARRCLRARAGHVPRRELRGPDLLRAARPRSLQRRALDRRTEAPPGPDRALELRSRRSSRRWRSSTPTPPRRSATGATRRSRSRSPPRTRPPRTTTATPASRMRSPGLDGESLAAIAEHEAEPVMVKLEDGEEVELDHGRVVIAAITSCTNTSNPSVMIGAGLLARKAVEKGLERQALGEDLARAGLDRGHRVPQASRARRGPRPARLQPGRVRLHDLHRQLGPAAGGDLRGGRRQRPRRLRGALRQPQLRGPDQPGRAQQLPRLAAALRRLRARRADGHRSAQRRARRGRRRQPHPPRRHLALARRRSRRRSQRPCARRCSSAATPTCSRATIAGASSRPRRATATRGPTRPTCASRRSSRAWIPSRPRSRRSRARACSRCSATA